MTKNRSIKIAVLVLALALITSCFVGTTFAKYQSTGDGSSSARVALWKVSTGTDGAEIDGENSVVFDLFKTIKDSDGNTENDVKNGGETENIIAPGTSGSFALVIKNESEVTAEYAIDFDVTLNGIPLEFKVGEGAWGELADIVASESTKLAMTNGSATVDVQWRWAFGEDSGSITTDTALGLVGTATATVKATVTVSQVD